MKRRNMSKKKSPLRGVYIKNYQTKEEIRYASYLGLKYKVHRIDRMFSAMVDIFENTVIYPSGSNVAQITLAWYNGKVVGAAIKERRYDFSGIRKLIQVYVKPKFRKNGIGRRLVKRLGEKRNKKYGVYETSDGMYFWRKVGDDLKLNLQMYVIISNKR